MPQPLIYGDSYGDLGNRQLAATSAADQRYFQMLSDFRAQQRAQQEAQQHADSMGLQMQQLGVQAGDSAANRALQYAQLGQSGAYNKDALDQSMKIAQMNLDAQKARLGESDQEKLYNEAYQAIGQGTLQTPTQLTNFVGAKLPGADVNRLLSWMQEGFDKRKAGYDAGNRAASVLNEEYARRIAPLQPGYDAAQKDLTNSVPEKHWYWPTTWGHKETADVVGSQPMLMYNNARTKFFEDLAKSKSYAGLADYDPAAHGFVNVVPPPKAYGSNTLGALPSQVPGLPTAPTPSPSLSNVPTPVAEAPIAAWIPLPKTGIRVHPAIYSAIQQKARAYTNPADQQAYIQSALKDALRSGQAMPLKTGPVSMSATPPDFGAMNWRNMSRFALGPVLGGLVPDSPEETAYLQSLR